MTDKTECPNLKQGVHKRVRDPSGYTTLSSKMTKSLACLKTLRGPTLPL